MIPNFSRLVATPAGTAQNDGFPQCQMKEENKKGSENK